MRTLLRATMAVALCVAAWSVMAAPSDRTGKPARGYPFVHIDQGPGRTNGPVETNVVPLWPIRSCFGWVVVVRGPDRMVEMTEIQQAPGPTRFTGPPDIVVGPRSDTTTMKRRVRVVDGKLTHSWCVNDADPPGEWRFQIHVDGVFVAEFRFCGIRLPEGEPFKLEELACRNTTPSS